MCKLWQKIAMDPKLWVKVDLNFVKEKSRTELRLHWLIDSRLTYCQDLNLGMLHFFFYKLGLFKQIFRRMENKKYSICAGSFM